MMKLGKIEDVWHCVGPAEQAENALQLYFSACFD